MDESHLSESCHTNINVETVIKSDPGFNMDNIGHPKKQNSNDSESQRGSSHESSDRDTNLKQHIHLVSNQFQF